MKLSDIKGERVLDLAADIIGPITAMAQDEHVQKLFEREKCPEDQTQTQFFLKKVGEHLPEIIRGHKPELVQILASIKGVGVDEYVETLNVMTFAADIGELLNDEDVTAFLS